MTLSEGKPRTDFLIAAKRSKLAVRRQEQEIKDTFYSLDEKAVAKV